MQIGSWFIPKAWEVNSATVRNLQGEILINWENNNLHLMSYSRSISGKYGHEELMKHIHFDENKPEWIPYRTSYYDDDWAFCVSESEIAKLKHEIYQVDIDVEFRDSHLEVGDVYIPGKTKSEIVFTTYVCHPSMANNELSGPIVLQALIKHLLHQGDNYYSYRFLFLPETIGAIAYISENLASLQANVVSGFVVTCIGDNRNWGYIPSRTGVTMADKVAKRLLAEYCESFQNFTFLERGSDERQFCSPGVDLPFCSITRSKYATYPEYHTSGDDLSMFSVESLSSGIKCNLSVQIL
jgi:aminopeptidase-like protein